MISKNIFLCKKNIYCDPSSSRRDGLDEESQHIVSLGNKKK